MKILLNIGLKKNSTFFSIFILIVYGLLILLVPDFALWTASFSKDIYIPMKAYYSIYSVFSMTFIILPTYIYWIYSGKDRCIISLEMIRFRMRNKYVKHIVFNSLIESIIFALSLFIAIVFSSIKFIFMIQWLSLILKSVTTMLGLWVINILADIFLIAYKTTSFIPICSSFVLLVCEYLFYCKFRVSFIVVPLLSANYDETILTYFIKMCYALCLIIILCYILDTAIKRKSVY